MAIQIVDGFKTKCHDKYYKPNVIGGAYLGLQSNRYLIVRIPRLLARFLLLGLLSLSFTWLGSSFGGTLFDVVTINGGEMVGADPINYELLPLLFSDLKNEGILKVGDKALFISNGGEDAIYNYKILGETQMELISVNDLDGQNAMSKDSFDFIFTHSFPATADFMERILKVGGFVVIRTSEDPSSAFDKTSNYKIVYLRKIGTNYLAMRKTNNAATVSAPQRRRLNTNEAKKEALNKLEDVLLEPPRTSSGRSSRYLRRTKYLPDLMGDSLESYPRRVFIDVGLPDKEGRSGAPEWFAKNYPTRNRDFKIYKIETVTEESSGKEVPQVEDIGMSNWLKNNVKEEEYVVMKAEAEVVEEMMKSKVIRLVDELFLECKPKGLGRKKINGSRMAYWECLALYGRLRDEGVAVHQWWG